MKAIPKIVKREKPRDLHAAIKVLKKDNDFYAIDELGKEVVLHFAEDQDQWETGVVRIELGDEQAEIAIDPLMSVIYTAYDPPIREKVVGFWEAMKLKMRSFLVKKENGKKEEK